MSNAREARQVVFELFQDLEASAWTIIGPLPTYAEA